MAVKEFVLVVKYDVSNDDDLGVVLTVLQDRVRYVGNGTDDPKVRDVTGRLSSSEG